MAEVNGIRARYLRAEEVRHRTENGNHEAVPARGNGLLCFQVDQEDRWLMRPFLEKLLSRKDWANRTLELSVQVWYQRRTLAMNRLLWALLDILSMEVYGEHGWSWLLYQDMLERHAPGEVSKLTGRRRAKTSSQFNTEEMSRFLDDVFRELAEVGVSLDSAQKIADYWLDWYAWRGNQKRDPNLGAWGSLEDYRQGVLYCECCLRFLRPDEGSVDHIVTRGAGGPDEAWNLMRLCDQHHVGAMDATEAEGFEYVASKHRSGYDALIKEFPHIGWRVERARENVAKGGQDAE